MKNQYVNFKKAQENNELHGVMDVSPEEVRGVSSQVHLVDVRGQDEYVGELGHIAGSQLVVLDELERKIDLLPKDRTIVFICRSGKRSAKATQIAQKNGFPSVYNMSGGMMRWNELGFERES